MDKYEVLKQLGKGGMGTAYMVRRKDDASTVLAIKQVACQNTDEGNKALREAKMLQAMSHAHVVAYVDVFLNMEQGLLQVCTVMEFCKSGDLAIYLGKTKESGERIEEKRATNWMYQIADALCYLHSRQIVHRDLKPANVFLHLVTPTNMALKVGDFGLSATLEAGKRSSRVGTPCYLAPEILLSEQYGEVRSRPARFVELSFVLEHLAVFIVAAPFLPLIPSRLHLYRQSISGAQAAFFGKF
jgi:serine/threonine protein kinase